MQQIDTDTATIKREGQIISIISYKGAYETDQHARVNVQALARLANDELIAVVLDIRNLSSLSREARHVYTDEANIPRLQALAMIIESPMSKIIGNFYLALNRGSSVPAKLFTSPEKAWTWLQQQLSHPTA